MYTVQGKTERRKEEQEIGREYPELNSYLPSRVIKVWKVVGVEASPCRKVLK